MIKKTEPKYLALVEFVAEALRKVQIGFDEYQKECFVSRPSEFFCLELNGEAGELANIEKKVWKGKEIPHEKFESEAADVLIALMNYCNAKDVNLGQAVSDKLQQIEQKRLALKQNNEEY
ncbi:MAG: hypothetical protein KGZ71_01905 [Desulfobulbaceae bacterium]|nr:hypothetical protein [Candidatus Kapabacteria bacterium]MBS3999217.1 hypothetical protein [Desulfobulbaceae bacterium]